MGRREWDRRYWPKKRKENSFFGGKLFKCNWVLPGFLIASGSSRVGRFFTTRSDLTSFSRHFFLPPNLTEIDDVTLGFQGIGKFTEFYRVWPTSATIEARVYRVLLGLQLDSLFNKSSGSFTEFDDVTLGFVGIGTFTEFYRVFTGSTTIEAWVYRVLLGFQLDSLEKGSSGWVGVSPAHPPGGALSETARPTPLAATPTSFDCTRR